MHLAISFESKFPDNDIIKCAIWMFRQKSFMWNFFGYNVDIFRAAGERLPSCIVAYRSGFCSSLILCRARVISLCWILLIFLLPMDARLSLVYLIAAFQSKI